MSKFSSIFCLHKRHNFLASAAIFSGNNLSHLQNFNSSTYGGMILISLAVSEQKSSHLTGDSNRYHISWVIRQRFSSFQNNLENLDPSLKMDLDLQDCLGRVQLIL